MPHIIRKVWRDVYLRSTTSDSCLFLLFVTIPLYVSHSFSIYADWFSPWRETRATSSSWAHIFHPRVRALFSEFQFKYLHEKTRTVLWFRLFTQSLTLVRKVRLYGFQHGTGANHSPNTFIKAAESRRKRVVVLFS